MKNIYKKLIMLTCFAFSFNGLNAAVNIGFVPVGGNYFKAFAESTDGTIQVNVSNVGATLSALGESEVTIGFYIKVHANAPNYGTANLSFNDHSNSHMDDYNDLTFSATGTSNATNLSVSLTVSSDGNYDVVVDVNQDLRYEGGSGATPETINLYLEEGSSTDIVNVAKDFVYKITDDDQPPTYAFKETSTQTVQENTSIGSTGRIVPVAHSDGNIYLPGPDDFEVFYTISNGTTANADHRADNNAADVVGSILVYEQDYNSNGSLRNNRDLDHHLQNDEFDEPNETFTITLSENSSSYGDIGTNNTLNFIVEDHGDDLPPYVRFRDADQTVSENGAPAITVVAQLVNASGDLLASGYDNVSVGFVLTGSTALNSGSYADHDLAAGELTFGSSGDTEQNITFNLVDDAYDEGVNASVFETVVITFDESNVGNTRVDADGGGGGQRFVHTMNIQDDDAAPTMSFSANTSVTATSGSESVTSPVIKVILDAASGLVITAAYTNNASGSATIYTDDDTPWDYKINGTTGSGTITIPAYSTDFAIPITINSSEEYDEDNETMKIDFTAGNNVGGGATHTYTINDDDDTPSLYFTNNATTISSTENGSSNITNGEIAIRLSAPSGKDVSYAVAISSYDALNYGGNSTDDDGDGSTDESNEGAAVGGASGDFKLNETTGTVSAFGAGTSSITYTHYGDDTDELDKYIKTVISLASGELDATIPSDGTQLQVIKLADDESAATLGFASGTDNGSEGDAAESITVSKTGATEFTLKTTISVSNATATDGATDDDYDLATSGGVAIASGATQVLTFGPSDTDQSISLTIDNDDLYEGGASGTPETVEFSIGSYNAFAGAGATETLTYSIIDNEDAPTIEFDTDASNSVTLGNESVSSPSITVKINRRSIFPATINYSAAAKSGTTTLTSDDYTLANNTVEIAALSTSATIPLQIANDSRYEADETIRITLASQGANTAIGSALTHDYTINANDIKPTLAFSSTVTNDKAESDALRLVTVSLSAISGVQSTVSYAFTGEAGDADYTDATSGAGTLTFAANTDQTQDITINFTDDTIDEDTETIIITLSGISGGAQNGSDLVHTINLADSDDPPPIGFSISGESPENSVTIAEGSGATYNPSIVLASGYSTEFDIAVVWSIDAANTDAIIDGETNQDFELRSNGDVALDDYSGLNEAARTVTLTAGQTSVDLLHIDFPTDDFFEDSETLVLKLSIPTSMSALDGSGNPVSANGSIITSVAGNATDTKTITITNKSSETVPKVSITATGGATEANTNANFVATLSANSGGASKAGKDLHVNYTIGTNGNTQATISSDYTLPDADGSRTFTIPAYASSATKSLTLLDDIIYEYNEDVVVNLEAYTADATAAAVVDAANAIYTYTITENDAAPVLEFADADRVAEYAESATARVIDVQFKSSGTQEAEMPVYGYVSVSTSGSKTTAENGVDICENSDCSGGTPHFENYEQFTIAPGANIDSRNFYFYADSRYEASQLVTFELETFTSAEVSGVNYNSYPAAAAGDGIPPQSNATTDGDEEFAVTISASAADEKPIVQWVDNSGSGLPYSASSGSREISEGSASSGYFTLQLSKFSEKDITVNYSLIASGALDAVGHSSNNTYPVDYSYWGTGSDGTGTSTALSVAAGSVTFTGVGNNVSATSATQYINIPVALINDDINEWSESITLKINETGNDDVTGTGVSDKLVILDNDNPPVVKFTAATSGEDVNEETIAASSPSFTFGLYDASGNGTVTGKKIYFSVVTDAAAATPGSDFVALTNTVSDWIAIDAATNLTAQTAIVTLDIEDDLIDEENQEVKVTLDVLGADIDGDKAFSSSTTGSDERAADAATAGSPAVHTYTILDDDAEPVLRFSDSDNASSIDEGATETITIDFDPESPNIVLSEKIITVTYSVSTTGSDCGSAGGCATGGTSGVYDYLTIADNTSLSIPAGDTDGTSFTITAVNDTRFESPQDIVIKMDASSENNATVSGGTGSQVYTLTINDDAADKPTAQFYNASDVAASSETVAEDNGSYTVTVKLSTISEKNVTIPYSIDFTNSTAIIDDNNTDLSSTAYPSDWRNWDSQVGSTTLNFTAGGAYNLHTATGALTILGASGTSATTQYEEFIVNITRDDVDEEDETLIFVLDETLTNANGGGSEFALTISNDDDAVVVQFAASNPITGDEDAADPAFVIELVDASGNQKESGKIIVVDWLNTLGTAEATDINAFATTGQVTFTPRTGSSSAAPVTQAVTIDVVDTDATYETEESFTLSVTNTTNSTEVGTQENAYAITNIDPIPKVEFVSSTYTLSEAAGDNGPTLDIGYRIATGDASNFSELTEEDITVYFKVSSSDANFVNGTDISNIADYATGIIQATSTDASGSSTITLTATGDGVDEADENFNLNMYTYDASQTSSNANVSILSNAVTPQNSESGSQGYDQAVITLKSDPNDEPEVSFYDVENAIVTSAMSVLESDGVATVSIKLNSVSAKTVTIPYTLTLDYDNDSKTARVGSSSATSYPYDYRTWSGLTVVGDVSGNAVTATGTIDIAAGQERIDFNIIINNDDIYEFDETIKLSIGTEASPVPTNAKKAASNTELVITVKNDGESKTSLKFSTTLSSDNENTTDLINFPIVLESQSGKDVIFKYTVNNVDNYPSDGDRFYNALYPNNKNIATKGIDYNFGSSITTNIDGDSIITIVAGQTTASIPLTIINDGYDEYDQVLRVSISVLSALVDNDAAENGDDSVYTFTIIDEDAEPYIRFEANVVVAETNAGNTLTKDIEISLVDEDSAPIESEKTITASYIYDTTETSGDYTSASLNGDGIYNEYEDDFFFENSSLSFSGRAYSYNPATKVFEETSGQNSKTVSLSIYGDALYEVDEYVNIELTPSDFVQSGELSSGDHSFVYTIQDDDGRPTVTWLEPSKNIQEGDPNDANGEGNYQNADIKVTLSKLSGTDILVQYSEKAGGTAESGTNTNFDFYLGADNTDLVAIGVNTKSVIIPAATSASSDLTLSVPIESWDDDIVEKTLTANYENFFLQIDAYRDKGPDKSWATVDDGLKDVSSENVVEVTIIDNDLPPSDFTVGSILTKTSNTDTVVASFWNPITPDYWNSYNTGLTVKIPIENNVRLDGGTVRLIAKVEGFSYNNILTSTITIIDSDLGDSITFDVSAQDFEGTEASPTAWFSNGNVVQISAIIADKDGNETTGSASPTSITIDEAVPSIAFYDINSVSSVGGTEVPNYWNGTNLEFNVNVKVLDVDQTVSNGKIRILAGIGGDESAAVYEKLGSPVSIAPSSNVEDGTVLVTISKEQIESLGEFVEGDSINIKGEIVDIAGNRTTINISTIKTFIDTTSPQINSVKSINIADGNNKDGLFGIDSIVNLKLTFSESLTLTSGTANIGFSDESISGLEIQQSSLQSVASIIVPYTVQANDISSKLTFTGLTSSAGNFRDVAGNDMTIFTAIDGSSLENLSTVEVDGLAPSAFTVDTVIVQGINTVSGYWNSNSTSLIIPLTNSKDQSGNIVADGDPSLIGGKVQILGRVWNTSTNTPGAYIEVGTTIILTDGIGGGTEPSGTWNEITGAYNYGQFPGKTLHFEIDAATMESALSVLANYPDESSANPEQNGKIDFAAIITDKAGNPMQGIATLGSELIVDEVMPLDPAIGLPLVGYNYTILSSIDNYIEILPDTVSGSGFSRSGFYNSTNTGVQFKSWIAFDDPNGAITIDRDVSLVGGNVQVQMASTNDASTATWSSIGDSAIVQQSDVDAGFITIIIDSSLIESISDDFVEGKTLYFRNKVTDKAGNIAYQSTVSNKSLIIDETPHVYADLTYSRKYVNGVDHIPTVTIKFDPTDYPYSPPKVSAIYETGNVPPIATTNALMAIGSDSSTYTYELDIPGDRSSNNYDGIVSIAIDATDKAGNPILTASVTNKDYLMVDNTRPEIEFKYENTTYEIAKNENKGKSGHIIKVVALPSEPMFLSPDLGNEVVKPTLSVDSLSTPDFTTNVVPAFDGDYNNIASDGDSITFSFTLPTKAEFEEKEFNLRLFINGTDLAGNSVDTLTGYTSSSAFTFDNKAPYFDQFLFADNSFIRTSTLRWYNNEQKMNSANIKFEPVDALASPSVVTEGDSIIFTDESLSGGYNELDRGLKGPYLINNNTLLTDALADSNTYNIIFKGTDMVGNVGSDTIKYVTFDTKAPTAKVTYETEYITSLSPKAGTVINVTFNEIQTVAPTMRLFYGADSAQNKGSASWIVDDLNTYIDTSSSAKIDGPITLINSSDDAKTWYHDLDSTDVQSNSEEIIYDGFIWAQLYSNDLAGNTFDSDSLIFSDFTNSLYLDNTEPTATLTYTNLRDSLLTEYSSDAELSYCCFAIAGDTVLVKVEMNEKVKYEPGTLPTLTLKYNSESVIEGYTQIGIEPISYPGFDIKDDVEQTAMTFHYKIVIQDSAKNDGTLKVTLNANDRSGTPITTYGSSLQKSGQVESSVALEIDNIHPWGDTDYPIFGVAQSEVTFPTGKFITTGFRVIENWINKATDNIYIDVPYQQPSTDSTLLGKNSGWGPQGKIDLQIRNIDLGTGQWQIFGNEDTIKSASSFTPFGNYTNMITINRGIEDLIPETMLNTGEGAFNRIQFRAVLKDKHGNITYGKPSDADSSNTENLFFANSSNTDTIRYDIVSPSLGAYNDGNFAGAVGSKIISSDTVSIGWSEFTDPGGAAASGVDLYEMQVYVYPSTWTGGNAADTLNRIDSLFTVDMDLDGIDDPGYWYKIYKEQAPSFNNPITVNSLESTVNDSISNMDIIYDYNDTLKHELHYMIYVRAFDVAGNASDTIYTNAIQRYNSAPVIIDNIADLILYEDVAWDYDTVKVTDLDLSTLQNDTFTYFIAPKKLVINSSGGLDSNLISINPPTVDSLNGLVSWTPIQDSTLTLEGIDTIIDQSGEYVFTFYVEDAYGFRDTINYNAIVNAVNDTPNVAILAPDRELSWAEDKPASEEVKINLSNYVRDIDNLDSELSWQFVIMDTSQLDEDFPLASVIIGPGTPKPVQTKLMKDYLGFDPSKGVDIPTLAKKSGSTTMRMLSAANSLITVDIDTTTDDNIYAIFNSDSNYHGSNHRVIFRVQDPFGAFDLDTVIINIIPENDPPVVATIDTIVINENDSIWIDFSQFTSDVDDSTLTFKIEGIYNTDSVSFLSEPYLSDGFGDTVLFNPFDLWSGSANFRITASDEEAESSQLFTLNVLRVPRPEIEVSLIQNNAFSSYVSIIIIDKQQKTKYLQLEVQNQRIDIDTVGAHTYTGDFSFGIGGGYSFDVIAVAEVGKTIYTNTFNLAPARVANRWYANSSDGRFSISGEPGSVDMDRNFLVLDSSLFIENFSDQASYVLGDEYYIFNKPIEINFGSIREDLAIYQRENGVIWKELPSLNRNGQILTFTENAGYFRLGPKTIIVPEETDLHQNYPNPFNPSTTIKYDIGLMDGLEQKVSVNVYNVVGQQVSTLVNNISQVGQFYVRWDGADKFGKTLPSGIYFIQLRTESGIIKNKKMMFLK